MEMPDLSGQPAWVVIVVFGLFAFAGVAGVWVRRRRKLAEAESETEERPPRRSEPPQIGAVHDGPIHDALRYLNEAARADREEAAEARRGADLARNETARLQGEVARLNEEMVLLRIRLSACEERTRLRDSS